MKECNQISNNIPPPGIADFLRAPLIGMQPAASDGSKFSDVLTTAMQSSNVDVNFSAHARQRLELRGITLDNEDMVQLDEAIDKAEEKGAHNSLIVLDGNAFVVNIDNRTVVTALDSANAAKNVFTQIDSAVVM